MDTPYGNSSSQLSPQVPHRTSKRRGLRRSEAEARNLTLYSARTAVPIRLAAESPTLMLLAVEDLCWQLAVADLAARRPPFWHRTERAAWHQERQRWEAKRARLAAMAHEAIAEL
jgi:hypothetical protein